MNSVCYISCKDDIQLYIFVTKLKYHTKIGFYFVSQMSFDPSEPTLYENILSKEVIVLSSSVFKVCTIAVVIFLLYSFFLICESGYMLHLYLVIYLFFLDFNGKKTEPELSHYKRNNSQTSVLITRRKRKRNVLFWFFKAMIWWKMLIKTFIRQHSSWNKNLKPYLYIQKRFDLIRNYIV